MLAIMVSITILNCKNVKFVERTYCENNQKRMPCLPSEDIKQ